MEPEAPKPIFDVSCEFAVSFFVFSGGKAKLHFLEISI